jgi:hypothetical protein
MKQIQFITTIDIDEIGYKELLKQGYSEVQITGFIKQKIEYAFDLKRLGIVSSGITLESVDDYDIKKKPESPQYSTSVSEDESSVHTIKRDKVSQREW